jgi:hypothetical protein
VALAVGGSTNERANVLSRLASAEGYTVFDRGGRRVGTFIELAGGSGEEIAIRHDGVFLWHRRVLPLSTVATVFPERGAVVLNVDRRALKSTDAASTPVGVRPVADTSSADEGGGVDEDWQTRITRFIGADGRDTDATPVGEDDERTDGTEDVGRLRMGAAGQLSGESSGGAENSAEPYLLFVSTAHGYRLVEQQGPPPATLDYVEVPEHDGVFRVAKLAISPLPNDRRVCAYLERIE